MNWTVWLLLNFVLIMAPLTPIETFSPTAQLNWQVVNDGVMGGLSESQMQVVDGAHGQFSGTVSLENNGGFASCRAAIGHLNLAGTTGAELRIRGDGQVYDLRIRVNGPHNRVAYRSAFRASKGDWETVKCPWAAFTPTFRGRQLKDVPPIDPGEIREIGFLIANKQDGAFQLDVDSITAY